MTIYIVNIPSPCLVRKKPKMTPTSFMDDRWNKANAQSKRLDLSHHNVTMILDGVAWLMSQHVVIEAESPSDALDKARAIKPNFKRYIEDSPE